jgi:aminoglycoside phosphotransferase (APT) family kinase protein
MSETVQGSLLTAVRGYASAALGCSPDRITAVTQFEGGNRHGVYRVSYLDALGSSENAVIRVSYTADPAECVQAEREAAVLTEVGGRAAPLLYDFRLTSPWFDAPAMCMQFVPGLPQDLTSAGTAEIARLGSIVGWVHARPAEDLVQVLSTSGSIESYAEDRLQSILSGLAWVREPLPASIRARLNAAADVLARGLDARRNADSFRTSRSLVLLHGDPAEENILWAPDPVLIDWEYARLGDPADEIAYLFDQNGLTAQQREAFWRGYGDGNGVPQLSDVVDRVSWWEPAALLGSTLWWVERWVRRSDAEAAGVADPAVSRERDYYFDRLISRLDRLDSLLTRQ